MGAKGDWDFRISVLVKNPDGTDILTPAVNFGEVRRAQLAKSISSLPRWCPWDLFRSFKVCSEARERERERERESGAPKAKGSYRTYSSLVKLQPWFLSLWWKTCVRQNCSLCSCACIDGPALGQNTLTMIYRVRRVIGISGSLIWTKTLMELIF